MSIQKKILTLFLITVIVSGGVATLIGRMVATDIVEDEISDHLITTAQSRSHHIESMLESARNQVELMASVTSIYVGLLESGMFGLTPENTDQLSTGFLMGMAESNPDIYGAFYVKPDGIVDQAYLDEFVGHDMSDDSLFQKGLQSAIVGATDFGATTQEWVLGTAAPVYVLGQLDGVIVLLGGENSLFEITTDVTGLGETGEVYLVDEQGYMITPSRFRDGAVYKQQIDLTDMPVNPEANARARENYQGTPVLSVSQPIYNVGWTMVAEIGSSEALSPVSDLTTNMLWGLGVVLVIGILVAFLFSRTISRPILQLRRGSEEVMKGNWDYDVSTNAKDEIGELSRAFSNMTSNLRKSEEELRGYSQRLEQKVEQRTRELTITNEELTREIADRKKAEEAVQQSEEKYRTLVEGVNIGVYRNTGGPKGRFLQVNSALARMHGYDSVGEFVETPVAELYQNTEDRSDFVDELMRDGSVRNKVLSLRKKDGTPFYAACSATVQYDAYGKIEWINGVIEDITERKRADEALQEARDELETRVQERTAELETANLGLKDRIEEREVLLKEIHHRVKNNLQIISSLLNLQKDGIRDDESRMMFEESQNRVKSMALIHESLYQSGDLAQIDFSDYVRTLTGQLIRSYSNGSLNVELQIQGEDIFLGVDTAIPCGLMINELITNSLKYAFPNGETGHEGNGHVPQIKVEMGNGSDDRFTLVVSDNGIGLPEDLDYRNTETLGLQLVTSLVAQLRATLEVNGNGGTTFQISIPIMDS